MLRTLSKTFREWQERRQAIRDLAAMPEYLLNDIGVERHAIGEVVDGLQTRQRQATLNTCNRQSLVDGRVALR